MTVAELDAKAKRLRADGLTYREIGERMGESKYQAWRRCNRERLNERTRAYKARNRETLRAYDREYNATHKGTCSSCGGEMDRKWDGGTCAACRHDEYDRKAREVERLWNGGATFPEIQAAMGWTKGMLGRMMDRYRADGYDLPYRYKQGKRNAMKFPELRR